MALDHYYSRVPSFTSSTTAYTGADGHIDVSRLDDDALYDDSVDSTSLRIPKTALSTRLLSSLPSQPVAAAALTRSRSILHSRAKSLAAWTSNFTPIVTPVIEKSSTLSSANRIIGDLFSGESAPVRLGIPPTSPAKEETEFIMDYKPALTQRSSFALRRKSAVSQQTSQSTPKQSWFTRKSAAPAVVAPATATNDELYSLNIHNSLFPNGPADSFSPSDFNDLLLNATGLLERMQAAYREKVEYITTIQPEIDAQREEVEEAETRARHLKMQLQEMGRKAQEHETAMSQLATQLSEQKIKAESIRTFDDEHNPSQRRKRGSAGSASDSGFESDWDRDTESVISSGVLTPQTPPASIAESPFDNLDERLRARRVLLQRQAPLRAINLGYGCIAHDNAAQLDSVRQLRSENLDLQRQVHIMQQTLQGCIDFVDTVHI